MVRRRLVRCRGVTYAASSDSWVSFRVDSISLLPAGHKIMCTGPSFHHRPFSHHNGLRSYKPYREDTPLVIQMPYGSTFRIFPLLRIAGPSSQHPSFSGSGGSEHKPFGSFLLLGTCPYSELSLTVTNPHVAWEYRLNFPYV